jgi:hypothetical protein
VDGETGYLVEPFKVDRYAKAIERLLLNPDLRGKMGLAGREHVEKNFSWDLHADILEGAIQDAVLEFERARERASHRRIDSYASPQIKMHEAETARIDLEAPQ